MMLAPPRPNGFTLVEMLVVLTIIALVSAVGASLLVRQPAGLDRAQVAAQVRLAVTIAAEASARTGQATAVDIAAIPIKRGTLALAPLIGTARMLIVYADGSSNGGTVTLGGKPLLEVDWLTAAVTDARP